MKTSALWFFLITFAWLVKVGTVPTLSAQSPADTQLVTGGRSMLNLSGAEVIIRAAREKAEAMKLKVNIAVVDDGGHLLSFARMDGARPASGYTSLTKAVTAATFRQETRLDGVQIRDLRELERHAYDTTVRFVRAGTQYVQTAEVYLPFNNVASFPPSGGAP